MPTPLTLTGCRGRFLCRFELREFRVEIHQRLPQDYLIAGVRAALQLAFHAGNGKFQVLFDAEGFALLGGELPI